MERKKNSNPNLEKMFKILLLGDCSVGKTCFLLRYMDDTYSENHISTIGVDYKTKIIERENLESIKLQIWDTAGQDKFRSITKNYFRGSNGIMLIFDITNLSSFKNIKKWIKQIREVLLDKVCITLIGNKSDLEENRIVKYEEAQLVAKENNMDYFETSAKENKNINNSFDNLIDKMIKYNEIIEKDAKKDEDENKKKRNQSIKISKKGVNNDNNKQKKGCC